MEEILQMVEAILKYDDQMFSLVRKDLEKTVSETLLHGADSLEARRVQINEFKAASEKVLSSDFVKETVAKYFNINKDDLASNKRSNEIAFPRQIAMYLCREVANMSYPKIGEDFGNRDHSTVMHACKKIEKEVKDKNNTRLIVESVKNIIINGEQ